MVYINIISEWWRSITNISSSDVLDSPSPNPLTSYMIPKVLIPITLGALFVAGVNQYVTIISAKTG